MAPARTLPNLANPLPPGKSITRALDGRGRQQGEVLYLNFTNGLDFEGALCQQASSWPPSQPYSSFKQAQGHSPLRSCTRLCVRAHMHISESAVPPASVVHVGLLHELRAVADGPPASPEPVVLGQHCALCIYTVLACSKWPAAAC